jgi:LDH2 family malate/lactate/ureidoglycolate dehydrogenase
MPRFLVDHLRPVGVAVMEGAGATHEEAGLVVDHCLESLLSGEDNHGQELGTQYIPAMREGILKPGRPITVVKETPTTLMVDGNFNFGHYVSHHTMQRLIEKASTHHVAAASIRYQCHVGRLIDYTAMAARAGMIALMMTDGAWGPKFVAPWGGTERRLGVNPWSMAVPHADGWLGFDMTSGAVSMMKVFRAAEEDRPIPEGWIIDAQGRPTTDPNDWFRGGSALPVGGIQGHKGYVLTFMIELLADVLSGMEFRAEPDRPWPIIDGSFMALFDVEAFRPLVDFTRDANAMIDYVKSSPLAEGSPGIYYPGERSQRTRTARLADGVPIPARLWARFCEYAEEFGAAHLLPQPVAEA